MKTTCLDGLWQEGRAFLGVRYPLMCGAMTWISDAALVKAVGAQGGFGCLAAGNMPGEALAAEIQKAAAGKSRVSHWPATSSMTISEGSSPGRSFKASSQA